jgi:hypothetical protein
VDERVIRAGDGVRALDDDGRARVLRALEDFADLRTPNTEAPEDM